MSTKLQNLIESHASQFATAIVAALKGMSIEEIFGHKATASHASHATHAAPAAAAAPAKRGPGRPKKIAAAAPAAAPKAAAPKAAPKAAAPKAAKTSSGRRIRRSAGDIANLLDQVVGYVASNPGSRSEHIVSGLGIDKKLLPRPIAEGLKSGVITKTGEKRATQYFAAGAGGGKKGKKK